MPQLFKVTLYIVPQENQWLLIEERLFGLKEEALKYIEQSCNIIDSKCILSEFRLDDVKIYNIEDFSTT